MQHMLGEDDILYWLELEDGRYVIAARDPDMAKEFMVKWNETVEGWGEGRFIKPMAKAVGIICGKRKNPPHKKA